MTRAIYPASFDPITFGHVDIATRAAALFDELIVGVYDRPSKNLLFSPEQRWRMTREALASLPNVRVERYNSLTIEFARQHKATVIVRGLRVLSDFELELQFALNNRKLAPDVDTICLMASQEYSFLSSSMVKEIAFANGDVTGMVPPHVAEALRAKVRAMGGDSESKVKLVSLRD